MLETDLSAMKSQLTSLNNTIIELKADSITKHNDNRKDYHDLRGSVDKIGNAQNLIQSSLDQIVGTRDRHGLADRMESAIGKLGDTITHGLERAEQKAADSLKEFKLEQKKELADTNSRVNKLEIQLAKAAGYVAALGAIGGTLFEVGKIAVSHFWK